MSYSTASDVLLDSNSIEPFTSVVEEEGMKYAQTMADSVKGLFEFYNYFTSKFEVQSFTRKEVGGNLHYFLKTQTSKTEETLEISGVDAKFSGSPTLVGPKKITATSWAGILILLLVIVIVIVIYSIVA
tara:strand:- start:101 stop:487 length:387 start_codon:yes stop_codon:yes gene_type:complete